MLATEASTAEKLWTASQSDVKLLADLRSAYRGRFDVRDALWWRAHPLEPTPDGLPDPASDLAPLQAAAYSRASAEEPIVEFVDPVTQQAVRAPESSRRLRELTVQLERDATALDAAIEEVASRPRGLTHRLVAARSIPPKRTLWRAALVSATVAALVGAGVTAAVVEGAPVEPSRTGQSGEVLAIFKDTSRYPAADLPALGNRFAPDSIRTIAPRAATRAGYGMFVAQNSDGHYCIVLQHPDGRIDARCAPVDDIAASGLRLQATVAPPPFAFGDELPLPSLPVDASVRWGTDGTFTVSFSPVSFRPQQPSHEESRSCCGVAPATRQRIQRG